MALRQRSATSDVRLAYDASYRIAAIRHPVQLIPYLDYLYPI